MYPNATMTREEAKQVARNMSKAGYFCWVESQAVAGPGYLETRTVYVVIYVEGLSRIRCYVHSQDDLDRLLQQVTYTASQAPDVAQLAASLSRRRGPTK